MLYIRRYSGEVLHLNENQIFVFNSYSNGLNKAGTAKAAVKYHGAKPGIGEGPTGQCYAIPSEIPLEQMHAAVERFIQYAIEHPELEFLVTPIGVGQVFKRDRNEMGMLFFNAIHVKNIILPQEFAQIINNARTTKKEKLYHIDDVQQIDYKVIEHSEPGNTDSSVIKLSNGKYALAQLSHMRMGGGWEGLDYYKSMQNFDSILLAVIPKHLDNPFSNESEFIQSCVIVQKNGLWGCISTRLFDNFTEVIPIKYSDPDDVKTELKKYTGIYADYIWMTYADYKSADEIYYGFTTT